MRISDWSSDVCSSDLLMIAIYPPEKRGMALALISMVTVVAPVVGPILGGWITESYSWRWIFFINIPIGFFCSFVARHQLKAMVQKIEKPRMDYIDRKSTRLNSSP